MSGGREKRVEDWRWRRGRRGKVGVLDGAEQGEEEKGIYLWKAGLSGKLESRVSGEARELEFLNGRERDVKEKDSGGRLNRSGSGSGGKAGGCGC